MCSLSVVVMYAYIQILVISCSLHVLQDWSKAGGRRRKRHGGGSSADGHPVDASALPPIPRARAVLRARQPLAAVRSKYHDSPPPPKHPPTVLLVLFREILM